MNIDYISARYGLEMVNSSPDKKKLDNIVTSALNILHQQGLYAMFLWLNGKPERRLVGQALNHLFTDPETPLTVADAIFPEADNPGPELINQSLAHLREQLTGNLQTLFFAQKLVNQTLIYARHGAKTN